MKEFIESYYQQVYPAVSRLTAMNNQEDIDLLTTEIVDDLWERKALLESDPRKGVFIYKIVLAHVLNYLKARGEDKKLNYLQNILLISPANYSKLAESPTARNPAGELRGSESQADADPA